MENQWQKEMLVGMTRLELQFKSVSEELKSLKAGDVDVKESVEGLRRDMNGRIKKIEHTVFGNEEENKIGLAEKARKFDEVVDLLAGNPKEGIPSLPDRVRSLESGWAKLTAVAVMAVSLALEGVKWAGHALYAAWTSGKTHS